MNLVRRRRRHLASHPLPSLPKVVPVPTNKPSRRTDHRARLYLDRGLKLEDLSREVLAATRKSR